MVQSATLPLSILLPQPPHLAQSLWPSPKSLPHCDVTLVLVIWRTPDKIPRTTSYCFSLLRLIRGQLQILEALLFVWYFELFFFVVVGFSLLLPK